MNSAAKRRFPPLIAWASVLFSTLNAMQLWSSWKNSPAEITGKLGFALWLVPIFYYWLKGSEKQFSKNYRAFVLLLGIIASLLSSIVHLNVLAYIGLSLCIASFLPFFGFFTLFWLLSSIIWMPITSWVLAKYAPYLSSLEYYGLRLGLNAAVSSMLCLAIRSTKMEGSSYGK